MHIWGLSPESCFILAGSILLAGGMTFGWFCYSKATPDEVEKASYMVGISHSFVFTNVWIWGAFFGVIIMFAGMTALFLGLVGTNRLGEMALWYKTVFGSGSIWFALLLSRLGL